MPCYRPVTAWRSTSVNEATGKRSLVFSRAKGQLGSELQVPCNNCVGCRLDRSRSWSTRIMHERREHELAVFLTFTYSDEHLPEGNSLLKRDFQLFMKRLRKYHHYYNGDDNKLKYFMCGEYGGKTQRPHYHAIVFGLDFADKRFHKHGKRGDPIYTSVKLDELWGLGHTYIGSVSIQSAGYVARYCLDKINGEMADEHYRRINPQTGECWNVLPEYQASSQGLGAAHFDKHYKQMYIRDSCIVQGKEIPVPKYYDKKLEQIDPELLAAIKERRKAKALLRKQDSTYERLKVREEIKLAQVNLLKRELE